MRRSLRRIATAAHMLGHATRLAILLELVTGEKVVHDLAARLGIERARISYHLRMLMKGELVATKRRGRYRPYGLAARRGPELLGFLRSIRWGAAPETIAKMRLDIPRRGSRGDLRFARTCYDHLAGGAGVYLFEELLRLGWLREDGTHREARHQREPARRYDLTLRGVRELRKRKVNVLRARLAARVFAFGCPDWTLGRDHLGGALAAAVFRTLASQGLVRARRTPRGLWLAAPLSGWLHARVRREHSTATRTQGPVMGRVDNHVSEHSKRRSKPSGGT